jgi:protein MAK11
MAKRKRPDAGDLPRKAVKQSSPSEEVTVQVQIVIGSYERVLHGITAKVTQSSADQQSAPSSSPSVEFTDSFLFHAHASSIRCLALSPISNPDGNSSQNIVLASGGADERVNLYSISLSPPATDERFPSVPTLVGNKILENPKNRELGSLLHHSSTITALCFPTRSKLLTASEDNTISIIKTKDWSVISTIKAPRPKVQGRPSGDTAPPGAGPAGVNGFAVHPSMKLMLSVGRGERCMRLWNLVTGKKAGVLNFGREILESVKEGKWSSGEGKGIVWDSRGEEYAVAFERGVVVFGIVSIPHSRLKFLKCADMLPKKDSQPKCRLLPSPLTKIHHMTYVDVDPSEEGKHELLAVSTESGQVLFYDTKNGLSSDDTSSTIPMAPLRYRLGGKEAGQTTRLKEFEFLHSKSSGTKMQPFILVTCSSDGAVKLWHLTQDELKVSETEQAAPTESSPRQVGTMLGTYETGERITCLRAFVMAEAATDDALEDEEEDISDSDEPEQSSDSDGSD